MYKISAEDRKKLLSYLTNKPYAEVFGLISLLVSLKAIEEEKEDKPKKVVM
tara:strand:+ start:27 stop:179 length:153 start_codon:yes stop_codon:yes gene_type:complete